MIKYAIIGAGWRSEFYIRISQALPEIFNTTGIYIRNQQKRTLFSQKYNIKVLDNLESLMKTNPDFIVSCVNKDEICSMSEHICKMNYPILTETPIGTNISQTESFLEQIQPEWKIQVAEQFHFSPKNIAIKSIIDSGILGEVHQVQLSACHDYHAISLIKFFLSIENEQPKITSVTLKDQLMKYNSRNGYISPGIVEGKQKISILEYKNKTALYDFSDQQYFSDIRSSRVLIRGTKGEISNDICTYINNNIINSFSIKRNVSGSDENLDGMFLRNITGNGTVLYTNPFIPARLSDEEIAIATCLVKMDEYLKTGKDFYSVQTAANDSITALKL